MVRQLVIIASLGALILAAGCGASEPEQKETEAGKAAASGAAEGWSPEQVEKMKTLMPKREEDPKGAGAAESGK